MTITQIEEQLLHKFFGKVSLDIEIFDDEGKSHRPREWFVASIEVIDRAIELMVSGEIVDYKYDNNIEEIVNV